MANEAEQALYEKLAAVPTFHPSTASLLPDDWTLEPGDVVTVRSDGQDYLTPVYSMSLDWNGASKVSIQSTGNKKRAPLSALQRRSFSSGRSGYKTQKDLDEAKVVYDRHFTATDKYVESTMTAVGVKLNPDGTPMVDPVTGEYVFDDQGATLASKVTATAGKLETEISERTRQGISFESRISQTATSISQVVTAIGKDGEVTAASIVTAINTDDTIGPTSSIRLSADKINLTGYVTATYLDTRLLNADALFSDTGYIGTIRASALTTGGNITSAGAVIGAGLYIGSAAPYTDVSTAIKSFGAATPSGGSITIPTTTLAGTAGPNINFNIADTAFYQNSVGIASISAWEWNTEEEDYIIVVKPKVGLDQMVYPPSITTPVTSGNATWDDSTWTKSVNIGIKGPTTSGVSHDLANSVAISVSENWRERVIASDGKSLSMTIKFAHGVTSLGNVTLTGIGNTIYTNGHTDGVTEGTATGRRLGWNAAIDKVVIPSTQSTSDTMIVKVPVKNPTSYTDPAIGAYGFSLDSDNDYVYILNEDDIVVARATNKKTGGTPLATQIDMQVGSASQSPPSAPSGTGSTMVFASTFSSLIDQYASQSGGPWYIPFDMTISGGTGTKRYYVRING